MVKIKLVIVKLKLVKVINKFKSQLIFVMGSICLQSAPIDPSLQLVSPSATNKDNGNQSSSIIKLNN